MRKLAYQPLYATITDANASRSTTSLRGRVEWVEFWLNSHFGSVMRVSARSEGRLTQYSEVSEAEQKIKEWQEKGKPKKVEAWKRKLEERKQHNKEQGDKEEVVIDINVGDSPKFKFNLNGIRFSYADLKLLQETKMRDLLGFLGVASAFALIPDIKNIVEAKTSEEREEAVKTFKGKRDAIGKFLKEEEDKIKAKIDGVGE